MKKIFPLLLLLLFVPMGANADCNVLTTTGTTADVSAFGHNQEQKLAVPITSCGDGFVSSLSFEARANGTPAQPVLVKFYTTTGSEPDTVFATSDGVVVGGSGPYVATFSTPVELANGVDYWVVFDTNSYSGANFYLNAGDTTGGATLSLFNGTTWQSDYPGSLPNLTFDIEDAPPPLPDLGGATSTVDQMQGNLGTAFYIFFIAMFGIIWLLTKRT